MNRLLGPGCSRGSFPGVDARQGGNQAERLVPKVLGLVDDDGHIGQLARVGIHQVPRGPVGVFLFNQAVGRQVRAVGLEDLPDAGALGASDRGSPSPSEHMQILVPAEGALGQNHLGPFIPVELRFQGKVGVRGLQGLVPCPLPGFVILTVRDSLWEVVLVQEPVDPLVEVDHFHAGEVLFICDEVLEVPPQVGSQVGREGKEQDLAVGRPGPVPRKPLGPVHGHHRLAGAGAAQDADGAVPVAVDQPSLRRVQEHPPLLLRRVQHPLQFLFVVHDPQAALRTETGQGRVDVVRVRVGCRRVQFVKGFLVRVARQQHLDRGLGIQGETIGNRGEAILVGDGPGEGDQVVRDVELEQIAVPQSCKQTVGSCLDAALSFGDGARPGLGLDYLEGA